MMNTYQVSVYQAGSTVIQPDIRTVAHEFAFTDLYVLFLDDSSPRNTVLAVPIALNPVITLVTSP